MQILQWQMNEWHLNDSHKVKVGIDGKRKTKLNEERKMENHQKIK